MSLFKTKPTAAPRLEALVCDFIAQHGDDIDNEQYAHFVNLVKAYRPGFFQNYQRNGVRASPF